MKKKTLNEEVSRIKNMMNKIVNEQFDDFDTQIGPEELSQDSDDYPSQEIKDIVKKILSQFLAGNGDIDEIECDLHECSFEIIDPHSFGYSLKYIFDVDIVNYPQYDPGVDRYPNGDPGYPGGSSDLDWNVGSMRIEVIKSTENPDGKFSEETIFEGDDFTDFVDLKMENGMTGLKWIVNMFHEKLNKLAENREKDDY